MSHVYLATNTVNGKQYVGFTSQTLSARKSNHKAEAASGRGKCAAFHAAILKYGFDAFEWRLLFSGTKAEALAVEAHFIEQLVTLAPNGYNLTTGGEAPEWSAESRAKAAANSRQASEETKARRDATTRQRYTPEERQGWSRSARLGKRSTPEHREAIARANRGKRRSPEVRAQMSAARTRITPAMRTNVHILLSLGARQRDVGEWLGMAQGRVSQIFNGVR